MFPADPKIRHEGITREPNFFAKSAGNGFHAELSPNSAGNSAGNREIMVVDLVISDMYTVCSFITSIAHYIFHINTLHKAAYRLEILLLFVIFRSTSAHIVTAN